MCLHHLCSRVCQSVRGLHMAGSETPSSQQERLAFTQGLGESQYIHTEDTQKPKRSLVPGYPRGAGLQDSLPVDFVTLCFDRVEKF